MTTLVEIQDIEAMRQCEGIDDVELRDEVRSLRVGDFVKLTFLVGTQKSETLPVRVTSIRGAAFRGVLAARPSSPLFVGLAVGSRVAFTRSHIHSIASRRLAPPARGGRATASRPT